MDDSHSPGDQSTIEYRYREHRIAVRDGEGVDTVGLPEFARAVTIETTLASADDANDRYAVVSYLVPTEFDEMFGADLEDMMENVNRLIDDMAPDESASDRFRVDQEDL